MYAQPGNLEGSRQSGCGLVGHVVARDEAGRPRGGEHDRRPRLGEHPLADVVVSATAMDVEAAAPGEERLADDERAVVDRRSRREGDALGKLGRDIAMELVVAVGQNARVGEIRPADQALVERLAANDPGWTGPQVE